MKHEAEVKELLISNTIHLVAEGGFEKATTKELALCGGNLKDLKMNEVYIYRFFGNKEALFDAAFCQLDTDLYRSFQNGVKAVGGFEQDTKERLGKFFSLAWEFILGNEENCRYYTRYYYSIYFKRNSIEEHKKLFDKIISQISPLFKEEADVSSILNSVFTTMLSFATRVYNGELEDNQINRPHIFNVLYCMMMTYFKDSEKAS